MAFQLCENYCIILLIISCKTKKIVDIHSFSPQFQQGVEMFEHIVASGQGNEILRQFGVDPLKAGPFGGMKYNKE